MKTSRIVFILLLTIFLYCEIASATPAASSGQTLYVPVYSEIPYGDQSHTIPLTATLSVRNADQAKSIVINKINYYDSAGKIIHAYLPAKRELGPLVALEFVVNESDRKGGISASFIVDWSSETPAAPPVIEAIMISTRSAQGISMTSPARVLEEK